MIADSAPPLSDSPLAAAVALPSLSLALSPSFEPNVEFAVLCVSPAVLSSSSSKTTGRGGGVPEPR